MFQFNNSLEEKGAKLAPRIYASKDMTKSQIDREYKFLVKSIEARDEAISKMSSTKREAAKKIALTIKRTEEATRKREERAQLANDKKERLAAEKVQQAADKKAKLAADESERTEAAALAEAAAAAGEDNRAADTTAGSSRFGDAESSTEPQLQGGSQVKSATAHVDSEGGADERENPEDTSDPSYVPNKTKRRAGPSPGPSTLPRTVRRASLADRLPEERDREILASLKRIENKLGVIEDDVDKRQTVSIWNSFAGGIS